MLDITQSTLETDRDGGEGNTNPSPPSSASSKSDSKKQPTQSRSWFFTFNNYEPEHISLLDKVFREFPNMQKFRFQEELGAKGTPHLQGTILLNPGKRCRWSEFKLPKDIHWEGTKDVEASFEYCGKEETRNGVMRQMGFPIPLKILPLDRFHPWQRKLYDMLVGVEPNDRDILWIWDTLGACGKTQLCKHFIARMGAILCTTGKFADLCNIVFNAKIDTRENPIVFFSLPRANGNGVSYSAIESIKDGMIVNTKYETGYMLFNSPHLVVFANKPPKLNKLSSDRWIVMEVDHETKDFVNPQQA